MWFDILNKKINICLLTLLNNFMLINIVENSLPFTSLINDM